MSDLHADDTGLAIVPVLACVLNQLCLRNDRLPISQRGVSKFHALRPPAITIKDYLSRVAKYGCCSGECFVLALVYIDRIIQSNPNFVVNSLNIHRLLITSIMLAAKFFDDQYYNNAYYAKVGGVPCNEVNSLEVEFLFMCNFTLFVTTDTYSQYYTELCNHAANVSNVCSCSNERPRVPLLVIPRHPHLSQPPKDLEGNVLYPIPNNYPTHLLQQLGQLTYGGGSGEGAEGTIIYDAMGGSQTNNPQVQPSLALASGMTHQLHNQQQNQNIHSNSNTATSGYNAIANPTSQYTTINQQQQQQHHQQAPMQHSSTYRPPVTMQSQLSNPQFHPQQQQQQQHQQHSNAPHNSAYPLPISVAPNAHAPPPQQQQQQWS